MAATMESHRPKPRREVTREIGILEDVGMSEFFDNEMFVFIVYRGWRYTGMMAFDSSEFCRQIYSLLKSNIGRPIKDIVDLVVGY